MKTPKVTPFKRHQHQQISQKGSNDWAGHFRIRSNNKISA
jgi:hypothetical protein